jgi:hypothetical protein
VCSSMQLGQGYSWLVLTNPYLRQYLLLTSYLVVQGYEPRLKADDETQISGIKYVAHSSDTCI